MFPSQFARRAKGVGLATLFSLLLVHAPGSSQVPANGLVASAVVGGALSHRSATRIRQNNLPFTFELNQGQTDPKAQFLSRRPGYTLFLRPSEAVLVLGAAAGSGNARTARSAVVRMQLIGADPNPAAIPEDKLVTRSNYIIGNNPANWHLDVPHFGRVRFKQVYPGIDLLYHGTEQQLEHDFVVAAGANPARISFRLTGGRPRIDHTSGDLMLRTDAGMVRLRKPVAYQDRGGNRREIAASYRLMPGHRVGFTLADYDRKRGLVIDPLLVYSTYLGGSGSCNTQRCNGHSWANAVAVDSLGNAYVTGITLAPDFPTSPGAFQPSNKQLCQSGAVACSSPGWVEGDGNAFVTKLNAAGTAILYSTYLGGSNPSPEGEQGFAIAVDAQGNAFVGGITSSPDFPTTTGSFQTARSGDPGRSEGFISKLNPSGSGLVYSTFVSGSNGQCGETLTGIAIDGSGAAYATGSTCADDFPTTPGAFQTTNSNPLVTGSPKVFVTKLNPAGTSLVYSTYLGGSNGDRGAGIALDGFGSAFVGGSTRSQDFPVTSGAFQTTFHAILSDATGFVTKLNPTGSALVYSTYLGGTYAEEVSAIAVNANGNAYVTGETLSVDFPVTAGAFQIQNNAFDPRFESWPSNAFVTELNTSGSALAYSTYLGGSGLPWSEGTYFAGDYGLGIAVDGSGDAVVVGLTTSRDFPVLPDGYQTAGLEPSGFVSEINPSGSMLLYSSYMGGSDGEDRATSVALDQLGKVYIAGYTSSSDFPVTSSAFGATLNAPADAFVSKFDLAAAVNDPETAMPVISLASGTYAGIQMVTISDSTPGASIYFTVNGERPTPNNWALYSSLNSPVQVTGTPLNGLSWGPQTIEAIAVANGYKNSALAIATYTINLPPAATPTFSILAGTYSTPQTVTISDATSNPIIFYTTDGSTPATTGTAQYSGPITISSTETLKAIAWAIPYSTSAVASATYTITPPTFSITGTAVTVAPGATTGNTSTISLTPSSGFAGVINLSCAITPTAALDPATCSIPGSVTISGTTLQTVTLSVNTTAASSALNPVRKSLGPAGGTALACLLLIGFPARRRRIWSIVGVLALLFFSVFGGALGCGGGGNGGGGGGSSGTTPGAYVITVTGTSGAITERGTVSLTVR